MSNTLSPNHYSNAEATAHYHSIDIGAPVMITGGYFAGEFGNVIGKFTNPSGERTFLVVITNMDAFQQVISDKIATYKADVTPVAALNLISLKG